MSFNVVTKCDVSLSLVPATAHGTRNEALDGKRKGEVTASPSLISKHVTTNTSLHSSRSLLVSRHCLMLHYLVFTN